MAFSDYIELLLGWLLKSFRNHDSRLFTAGPAFKSFPTPTIALESPSIGPSGSSMPVEYTQLSEDRFPTLMWPAAASSATTNEANIKEYILICEDADLPLPGSLAQRVFHSLFYSIPFSTHQISAADLEVVGEGRLKGGFKFTKNIRGKAYVGPKPVLGHGPHRYFYELVALSEPLDLAALGGVEGGLSKKQVAEAIVGKVVGWGSWVGIFERKWE